MGRGKERTLGTPTLDQALNTKCLILHKPSYWMDIDDGIENDSRLVMRHFDAKGRFTRRSDFSTHTPSFPASPPFSFVLFSLSPWPESSFPPLLKGVTAAKGRTDLDDSGSTKVWGHGMGWTSWALMPSLG